MNEIEKSIHNLNVLFYYFRKRNNFNIDKDQSLTYEEYETIKKHFNVWRLNEVAVDYFNLNMSDLLSYSNVNNIEFYIKNEEGLRRSTLIRFNELNEKIRNKYYLNKNYVVSRMDLEEYLPLLTEYLKISYHTESINKIGIINPISDIEGYLRTYTSIHNLDNALINYEDGTEFKFNTINLDDVMYYAWASYNYKLPEAYDFFNTLYTFYNKVLDVYIRNENNFHILGFDKVLSNFKTGLEVYRYIISSTIGLCKTLVNINEDKDTAIRIYYSILDFFDVSKDFEESRFLIRYWTGHNRLIECALELYLLLEDDVEKELLKERILKMFLYARLANDAHEQSESVSEPLLVTYMMYHILY